MGRQVCFYATPEDLNELFEELFLLNAIVLNDFGVELDKKKLLILISSDFLGKSYGQSRSYISKKGFNLSSSYVNDKYVLNQMKSEIIQFQSCTKQMKKIIDTSSVDNNFKKGGFVIIDDADEYNRQMNELMNSPTYTDNPNYVQNGFEYGRFWYSQEYYDDNGNKVYKPKELDVLFNNINKYIKKKFKLTKDNFAYIGPDAYKIYQNGNFIPCSGRNKITVE